MSPLRSLSHLSTILAGLTSASHALTELDPLGRFHDATAIDDALQAVKALEGSASSCPSPQLVKAATDAREYLRQLLDMQPGEAIDALTNNGEEVESDLAAALEGAVSHPQNVEPLNDKATEGDVLAAFSLLTNRIEWAAREREDMWLAVTASEARAVLDRAKPSAAPVVSPLK